MGEHLFEGVHQDIGARRPATLSAGFGILGRRAPQGLSRVPKPFAQVNRVPDVGHDDFQGRARFWILAVGSVLVRDAEVVGCGRRVACRDAGPAFGQRLGAAEVSPSDFSES